MQNKFFKAQESGSDFDRFLFIYNKLIKLPTPVFREAVLRSMYLHQIITECNKFNLIKKNIYLNRYKH